MDQIFYFASIRKLVIAFGTLFDNICIQKVDSDENVIRTIKVPFSYGPTQIFLARLNQAELRAGDYAAIESVIPRISFEFESISYDSARKLNPIHANLKAKNQIGSTHFQLTPVPYDITFNLNVYSELLDDSLQIIEQILPYFTPTFTVTVKEIPEMGIIRDVAVLLNSVSLNDNYLESLNSRRILIWTLNFTCKGNIYPPIRDQALINTIIQTIYTDKNMEYKGSVVTLSTREEV